LTHINWGGNTSGEYIPQRAKVVATRPAKWWKQQQKQKQQQQQRRQETHCTLLDCSHDNVLVALHFLGNVQQKQQQQLHKREAATAVVQISRQGSNRAAATVRPGHTTALQPLQFIIKTS